MHETLEPFSREYHDATVHGRAIALPLADSMTEGDDIAAMAREWMATNGVSMTARFDSHGKMFDCDRDKDARDIWMVTISRGRRRFTIRFGQSIVDSDNGIPPCVTDVLCCLPKCDPGTLADYIDTYGSCGPDEMKVTEYQQLQSGWRETRRQWRQMERVLADCDLDGLEVF
ncbi:MAG: hypothetical protein EBR82_42940 [Caulobacteraceae bacterium]|jgi:hypothetical protein|nr:hypothetical protein [Caulobacteraceae bacterium]